MRPRIGLPAMIAALAMTLFQPAGPARPAEGYRKIDGPCRLSFPADHGAHRRFRTEWWYYTGNLENEAGETFGFQLTFFRSALRPPEGGDGSTPRSAWRASQAFVGHAAVTDVARQVHLSAQIGAREALDMAGATHRENFFTIFVRDWQARIAPGNHRLRADTEPFSIDLSLVPEKPPVRHGNRGYSAKGSRREQASCYYSFTRMAADGRIRIEGRTERLRGTAWMDHEFFTAPLEAGLVGWDWFSLQFIDRTELMVYLLRRSDGTYHPASAGTFVDATGKTIHLNRNRLSVEVLEHWKSPDSGAEYPIRWRLSATDPKLALTVRPRLPNQEMDTRETTGVVYWEGSVTAEGTASGKPVSGVGYVEMTGYGEAFDTFR